MELAGELAGRTVLVTGGGPIGQLACRLAHLRSPGQILLMEPAPQRAKFAGDSHAVAIAADAAEDFAHGAGVYVVFECSGSAAAISLALKMLAPAGILVVVGAGPDPALDSATILLKEITVRGSYIYTDEFDRAIQLLAAQQVAVADLTTVVTPLPDALAAFDALRAGQIMKALIAPDADLQRHSGTQAGGSYQRMQPAPERRFTVRAMGRLGKNLVDKGAQADWEGRSPRQTPRKWDCLLAAHPPRPALRDAGASSSHTATAQANSVPDLRVVPASITQVGDQVVAVFCAHLSRAGSTQKPGLEFRAAAYFIRAVTTHTPSVEGVCRYRRHDKRGAASIAVPA